MCNLSQSVLAQGKRQGEQGGDDRRLVSGVKALMETLGSFEHAVKALKLSTKEIERCKSLMNISV